MHYQTNPNELLAMAQERHADLLHEASTWRLLTQGESLGEDGKTQPGGKRIADFLQSIVGHGKKSWSQTRVSSNCQRQIDDCVTL